MNDHITRDERLARILDGLAPVHSQPRKREFFLIAAFLILAGLYVGEMDFQDAKAAEAMRKETPCERAMKTADRHAALLVHVFNSGSLQDDVRIVSCRVKERT